MNRAKIIAAITASMFLAGCSSAGGQPSASSAATSTAEVASSSPAVVVQTAIPDGIYRTRPRTAKDLAALGLTRSEIANAKDNEHWTKSIVYELRIQGDQYLLVATSDGGVPYVADKGSFTIDGKTMVQLATQPPPCEDDLRFSWSHGALAFTLLKSDCDDAGSSPDFLYRAAYEALPFETVG